MGATASRCGCDDDFSHTERAVWPASVLPALLRPCLHIRDVFACGTVPKLEGSELWAGKRVSWWRAQMTRCVPAARYYVAATA